MQLVCAHVKDGEILEDGVEFLIKCFLREFDLSHVKIADSADLEVLVDNLNVARQKSGKWPIVRTCSGSFSLRLGQDNIQEIRRRRHRGDGFQTLCRHRSSSFSWMAK